MIEERRTIQNVLFSILNYSVFILFTFICVFPFYYIFINTISNNNMSATGKILFYPVGVHFENYIQVFKVRGLSQAAFISISRTVLGTIATLIGGSFLGYALCKQEYWNRKFFYRFVVVTMYFNAGLIPWFINMKNLGFVNNFWAYVIPAFVNPFFLILIKTFIESIHPSLEESAEIDGAGYGVRYFRIILPLSGPILATIAVFSSVGQWNSFMDTLFLMNRSHLFTLQFLLYQYLNEVNAVAAALRSSTQHQMINPATLLTATSIRMTISMVVVLPILFVYPFMQRYFVKGIMIGAVKG